MNMGATVEQRKRKRRSFTLEFKQTDFNLKVAIKYVKKRPFVVFVRFLFLFSVTSYIIVFYNSFFFVTDLSHRHFILRFLTYLAYGVAYNIGLYFITTELAKFYRVLSTILYLPTMIFSPFCMDYVLGHIFPFSTEYTQGHDVPLILLVILSFFIYYHFNPWRKMRNVS